jgi:hypothetical protein
MSVPKVIVKIKKRFGIFVQDTNPPYRSHVYPRAYTSRAHAKRAILDSIVYEVRPLSLARPFSLRGEK